MKELGQKETFDNPFLVLLIVKSISGYADFRMQNKIKM